MPSQNENLSARYGVRQIGEHADWFDREGWVSNKAAFSENLIVKHERWLPGESKHPPTTNYKIRIPLRAQFTTFWRAGDKPERRLLFQRGDIGVIPVGTTFTDRWLEKRDDAFIFVQPNIVERAAAELEIKPKFEIIEKPAARDQLIYHLALSLIGEIESNETPARIFRETIAHMLAVHLLKNYSSARCVSEPNSALRPFQIRRATEFVNHNLAADLSLATLAAAVNVSPFYFARELKKATGFAPHKFVLEKRLERAKELLTATNLPIVEIAQRVGFHNQSYFGVVFRRTVGVTPHRFRQQIRA